MEPQQPAKPKRQTQKWKDMSLGAKIVGIIGLAVIAFIGSAIIAGIISAISDHGNANKPATTSSHQTTQAKPAQTQTPIASLAALKAQVTPTLTTATTYLVNLCAKVQNDAAMSNAVEANSAFYHDKSTFDTTPDNTVYNA